MTVANRLSHGDNVRHKVLSLKLESPEVGADTPKAHLDFISDENTPCLVDMSADIGVEINAC